MRLAADRAAHRHAVESRQHDVEDDEIEPLGARRLQRVRAVARRGGREAFEAQMEEDELADVLVVLDDEDPHLGRVPVDRRGVWSGHF
jgi:hypothetical protein